MTLVSHKICICIQNQRFICHCAKLSQFAYCLWIFFYFWLISSFFYHILGCFRFMMVKTQHFLFVWLMKHWIIAIRMQQKRNSFNLKKLISLLGDCKVFITEIKESLWQGTISGHKMWYHIQGIDELLNDLIDQVVTTTYVCLHLMVNIMSGQLSSSVII